MISTGRMDRWALNWTDISDGGLAVASQVVAGTASAGVSGDIRTAESYASDQFSQVTVTSTQLTGGQWIGPMVRAQNGGQNAYVGIYNWNNGSPDLMLFKRSGTNTWTQLGSTYNSGALSAGTQLQVKCDRVHDLVPAERCPADIRHRHQPDRRRAGHHVLRHRQADNWSGGSGSGGGGGGTTYSVGGSVSGLSGTVVLQDNGGDNLSVSANGSFTFATALAGGAAYSVTVKTNPAGQSCTVANGSGTVGSANVTNVAVTCTTNTGTSGSDDFNRADGPLGAELDRYQRRWAGGRLAGGGGDGECRGVG